MPVITEKIKKLLAEKKLSQRQLAGQIGYNRGGLGHMINADCSFSEEVIQKIAPILEVSPETIKGWVLDDKCPKNIIKMAITVKQNTEIEEGKLILTTKIDEILKQKSLSRTRLSKVIGYSSYGSLNDMIVGKYAMSPQVISKIAPVLEVTEDEIKSWIVAGKYSLEAMRVAVDN